MDYFFSGMPVDQRNKIVEQMIEIDKKLRMNGSTSTILSVNKVSQALVDTATDDQLGCKWTLGASLFKQAMTK